ncbi:MAG: hypothetical protein M1833_002284 [Piccolia ochrophora]|nr:MAG: hypothetical protein M1833_002284 [Piccolia ochrophora]
MPEPSLPDPILVDHDDHAPLSDQDVELLHLIILRAHHHPDAHRLPFRALFPAYDSVLREHGLDPDRDTVLFRVLVKIGGIAGGATLYEKFETLLEELGIQIEFADGSVDGERQYAALPRDDTSVEVAPSPRRTERGRGRHRRASFTSLYEVAPNGGPRDGRRTRSQSISSRHLEVSTFGNNQVSARVPAGSTPPLSAGQSPRYLKKSHHPRHVASAEGHLLDRHEYLTFEEGPPSRPRPHDRGQRRFPEGRKEASARSSSPRARAEPSLRPRLEGGPPWHDATRTHAGEVPVALPVHPSLEHQMNLFAERLHQENLKSSVRGMLLYWLQRARQIRSHHQDIEAAAAKHDRKVLALQALDTWRQALLRRREFAETARFFARLEQRAEKARDLYLLTKAFTHWAKSALDQVQRVSVARRHILRSKYFNAWRDITAVNELKVRRHGLNTWFSRWRERLHSISTTKSKAASVYQLTLGHRTYWAWFWHFCDRRAPQWRAMRIKKQMMLGWKLSYMERREREGWVDGIFRRDALRRSLRSWADRSRSNFGREEEARGMRNRRLKTRMLDLWKVQSKFAPIAPQISTMVERRIARKGLQTWAMRAKAEQEATKVCRLRMMRSLWTTWNDKLRSHTLSRRIDERLLAQTLYKWVLAERFRFIEAVCDRHLKQRILSRWKSKRIETEAQLRHGERLLLCCKDRTTMGSTWRRWKLQLQLRQQRERLALQFYTQRVCPHLTRAIWLRWSARDGQVESLRRMATHASFYFRATKSLRALQLAAVESRREKRRAAYAQIRRASKVRLAATMFTRWGEHLLHRRRLEQLAAWHHRTRVMVHVRFHLSHWRTSTIGVAVLTARASDAWKIRLSAKQMGVWGSQLSRHRVLHQQATYHHEMLMLNHAASVLKILAMRAFKLENDERMSDSLRARNDKKRSKNILRYWRQRAGQRRGLRPFDVTSRTVSRQDGGIDPDGDDVDRSTRRNEDWTSFEDGFDLEDWIPALESTSSNSAVPGYLTTPSKRAARAKALVRLSAASGVPRSTPLPSKLRGPVFAAGGRSRLAESGNSILGHGRSTFPDIPEVSAEGEAPSRPGGKGTG